MSRRHSKVMMISWKQVLARFIHSYIYILISVSPSDLELSYNKVYTFSQMSYKIKPGITTSSGLLKEDLLIFTGAEEGDVHLVEVRLSSRPSTHRVVAEPSIVVRRHAPLQLPHLVNDVVLPRTVICYAIYRCVRIPTYRDFTPHMRIHDTSR